MVACTFDHRFLDFWGVAIFCKRLSCSPFCLYFILMNREKAFETIIVLALVSIIASLWFHITWFSYVSVGLLAISFISKRLTFLICKGWLSFAHYLGVVMNYLLMFIIFYLFVTPLSFFQRLAGKNQIQRKGKESSYFNIRNHLYTKKDIENPW